MVRKSKKRIPSVLLFFVLSVVAKAAGALYKIPLVSVIGAEGFGLYQLVFPLYALAVTLVSGGITVAVSRAVSHNAGNADGVQESIVKSCIAIFTTIGVLVCVLLIAFSKAAASLLGNTQSALTLVCFAPSLIFAPVSATVSGYFQGKGIMTISGVGYMAEQILKAIAGLSIGYALSKSTYLASAGAALGVTVAEIITSALMVVIYLKRKQKGGKFDVKIIKSVISSSAPIALGALLMPLSHFADSIIVVNLLSSVVGTEIATAQFGLVGSVSSLINLPSVAMTALTASLLPKFSAPTVKASEDGLMRNSLKSVFLLGAVFSISLLLFAPTVVSVLYPSLSVADRSVCINLLRLFSPVALLSCLIKLVTVYMQGNGMFYSPSVILAVGVVIKTVVNAVMLKSVGIYATAVANTACYLFVFFADVFLIVRNIGFSYNLKRTAILAFSPILFASVAFAFYYFSPTLIFAIIGFIAGCAALVFGLNTFSIISVKEILWKIIAKTGNNYKNKGETS